MDGLDRLNLSLTGLQWQLAVSVVEQHFFDKAIILFSAGGRRDLSSIVI